MLKFTLLFRKFTNFTGIYSRTLSVKKAFNISLRADVCTHIYCLYVIRKIHKANFMNSYDKSKKKTCNILKELLNI